MPRSRHNTGFSSPTMYYNLPLHNLIYINVKMSTIVGFLTFISMVNATSERLKAA